MKTKIEDIDFSITIDFDKNSENPARIFRSMTSIIDSFEGFDNDLIKRIDNKIETVMLLEDIEKGSLKSMFSNVIKKIPDSAIEDLDWKKLIGTYLVKAKYILLNKLEGRIEISDGKPIEAIEMELKEAAKETGIDKIPTYVPTNKKVIIKNIKNINEALEPLSKNDSVSFNSKNGNSTFNMNLNIDYDKLEELIVHETLESENTMILKVKKPDYLGESKWEFKFGTRPIYAKIEDINWLSKFQQRNIDVRPQDSLECRVKIVTKYDHNYEPYTVDYSIIEVVSIKPRTEDNQQNLYPEEEN